MPEIPTLPLPEVVVPFNTKRTYPSYGAQRRGLQRTGTRMGNRDVRYGARTIVVFPGDDIQSIINTLADDQGGIVFLKAGTHVLADDISGKDKVSIVGEGREISIIDCSSTTRGLDYTGTSGTQLTNFKIADLTLKDSNNTAGIDIDYSDFWKMENVRVTSCDQKGIRIQHSQFWQMDSGVYSDNNTGDGIEINGVVARKTSNFTMLGVTSDSNGGMGLSYVGESGTAFEQGNVFGCIAIDNTGDGIDVSGGGSQTLGGLLIVACTADSNGTNEFHFNRGGIKVVGCVGVGSIPFKVDAPLIMVGCDTDTGLSSSFITDDEINVVACGGLRIPQERRNFFGGNTSGGAVVIGDVVIIKSVADGDEFTTTTTQGDDKVAGMITRAVADSNTTSVMTEGYVEALKVDGTTDIIIGDFLGTFTTAKIAMKAAAGDMAFAIALEAYSTNDSNGVINALLIKPRKI